MNNTTALAIAAALSTTLAVSAFAAESTAPVIDLTTNTPSGVTPPKLVDGVAVQPADGSVAGTVIVSFTVQADGTTRDLKLDRSAAPALNEAAITSVLGRYYQPAMRTGAAVAVRLTSSLEYAGGGEEPLDEQNHAVRHRPPPRPVDSLPADCRFGTHQIAIDACSAVMAAGDKALAQLALFFRAQAYSAVGDYKRGIADYDSMLEAEPPFVRFLHAGRQVDQTLGKIVDAMALDQARRRHRGETHDAHARPALRRRENAGREIARQR